MAPASLPVTRAADGRTGLVRVSQTRQTRRSAQSARSCAAASPLGAAQALGAAAGSTAAAGSIAGFSGLRAALGALPLLGAVLARRLFRRQPEQRGRRSAAMQANNNTTATFSVATFNLRGVMDRWAERRPLLQECLRKIDADVLAFQECLTGEFGQERRLLPACFHVFPCKAALFNLARSGGVLRWYAHTVERLLELPPLRRVMVSLPPAVEGFRERLSLRGDFFRSLRDLAMAPFFGNSVACRIAEAHEIKHSTLVLGDWRAAQRIEFYIGRNGANGVPVDGGAEGGAEAAAVGGKGQQQQQDRQEGRRRHLRSSRRGGGGSSRGLADADGGERSVVAGPGVGGFKVWVVNTHLDHEHPDNRQRQALAVCDWMDKEKGDCAAIILCGDFNGPPQEPFHAVLRRLGYVSAYKERHGREPQGTWPTGIKAPLMDQGPFECLDYVYVWSAPDYSVRVLDAEVYGLQPAEYDKTLFPSDHAAVKATLEVSRKPPHVDLQAAAAAGAAGAASAAPADPPGPAAGGKSRPEGPGGEAGGQPASSL